MAHLNEQPCGLKMSQEDMAIKEKNLGEEAHKRKEYEVAISHYLNAVKLNPNEMSFIYHLAKINFEQKNYAECISICTKAIKVGKEQKANVKKDGSQGNGPEGKGA